MTTQPAMTDKPLFMNGLRVFESQFAVKVDVTWHVTKHPIRKRRRNYRVIKVTTEKPCAFIAHGSVVYMHPDLFAKLKEATP